MKKITYKMADGSFINIEVEDETATILLEERRYQWKVHKREKRNESIASIERREEKGEQVTEEVELSPLEHILAQEDEAEKMRLIALLPKAIEQLTPEQQELIQKVFYEGITQRKIAEESGVLETAISMRLSRIYKRLKKILEKF